MNKVYLLISDWANNGEKGSKIYAYKNEEDAKKRMKKEIAEDKAVGTIKKDWEEEYYGDTEYTSWEEDDYLENHVAYLIEEKDLL